MIPTFAIRALPHQAASPADHMAIIDALHRFTWGLDAKDEQLLASAFSEEGIADFSPAAQRIGMEFPPLNGRENIASALSQFVANLSTSHSASNARVAVSGDQAKMQALVEAQHLAIADHTRHYLMKNVYSLSLSRNGEIWLIDQLSIDNIWSDGDINVIAG